MSHLISIVKVKNVNSGETTITRIAKVSVKGTKLSMKAEDSCLNMTVNGSDMTLMKRKDEATEVMCSVMGVSKAMINYVLFCHQEESDWPLWSDQEVMNRFDKIFGTTEYNMAVEKLRKKRKELESNVKDKSNSGDAREFDWRTDLSFRNFLLFHRGGFEGA